MNCFYKSWKAISNVDTCRQERTSRSSVGLLLATRVRKPEPCNWPFTFSLKQQKYLVHKGVENFFRCYWLRKNTKRNFSYIIAFLTFLSNFGLYQPKMSVRTLICWFWTFEPGNALGGRPPKGRGWPTKKRGRGEFGCSVTTFRRRRRRKIGILEKNWVQWPIFGDAGAENFDKFPYFSKKPPNFVKIEAFVALLFLKWRRKSKKSLYIGYFSKFVQWPLFFKILVYSVTKPLVNPLPQCDPWSEPKFEILWTFEHKDMSGRNHPERRPWVLEFKI